MICKVTLLNIINIMCLDGFVHSIVTNVQIVTNKSDELKLLRQCQQKLSV